MSRKLLAGLLLMLGCTAAAAGEGGASSRAGSEVETVFDQACMAAVYQAVGYYDDRSAQPLSGMALALVKRCNANPNRMVCEVASKTMMREYGKTPFSCGIDTEYTGPVILLPDTR
jgi:hypothetical protein